MCQDGLTFHQLQKLIRRVIRATTHIETYEKYKKVFHKDYSLIPIIEVNEVNLLKSGMSDNERLHACQQMRKLIRDIIADWSPLC